MFSKIISTGSYLPKKILTNDDLSKIVDTNDEWIVSRTGIKQRHIAEKDQLTSDLAYESAKSAMEKINLNPSQIDGIIVATSTPDLTFPSVATIVQNKLGIKQGFAFDVQAVCSGFIYALSVADSMIATGKAKRMLVIGAETFSKILDWSDRNTCVLFGDGAGAMILEATEHDPKIGNNAGILGVEIFADGSHVEDLKTTGGVSSTQSTGCVVMNGAEVFKNAVNRLSEVADFILQKYNIDKEKINWLIPHQANIRIISAMGKKLGLDESKVVITLNNHGNTSAASIPLAFDYAFESGKLKKGDLILSESMGAGFTWGASIIRI
jgi:3-oxoacyl-[acyl-carrier-protein] synthase-3